MLQSSRFTYCAAWLCVCVCVCVCTCAQLFPTFWDPMDCSQPCFSVHGIFQVRILEWVAMPSSRGSSWPMDWTHISCISYFGRWILYHWATWEAHRILVLSELTLRNFTFIILAYSQYTSRCTSLLVFYTSFWDYFPFLNLSFESSFTACLW